ncbi:MAG: HIT family protein [Candidatus Pacearchaeota archaeon]
MSIKEEILKHIELLPESERMKIKEKIESMSEEELANILQEKSCFFCEVANKRIETFIVYENNNFLAFLDAYPAVLGQILIITRNHKQLSNFSKEEIEDFYDIIKILIYCFYKIGFRGYNLIINEGKVAGQNFDHFSCYLFPRRENDNFEIKWKRNEAKKEDLEKIFILMKNEIDKIKKIEDKNKIEKEIDDIIKFLKERKP